MESVDKLRELAADINSTEIISHIDVAGTFVFHVEWLDSWYKAFDAACDGIEREIAERYMELPVDADGVPIRVGDEMESDNERFVICAVAPGRVHRWHIHNIGELDKGTVAYPPNSLHHFKPRTIEDVLRDFQQDTLTSQGEYSGEVIDANEWKRQLERDVREYADELRELMEVE